MGTATGLIPMCCGLPALLAGAVAALAQPAPPAPPSSRLNLSEVVVGELTPGAKLELARTTKDHIAWVEKKGGAFTVRLDGKQVGGPYDDVAVLRFSADGQHLAFTAKRNGKWVLMIDGRERSKPYGKVSSPTLSADGKSFMMSACNGKQCRLVVDGEERPTEFEDISAPALTADGEHWGFFGRRNEKWTLQLDGKAIGPELDDFGGWLMTPDGKRAVVAGVINGGWTWVVDGTPGPGFEVISEIAFSPDSQHYAYAGVRASTGFSKQKTHGAMVEDGKVLGQFEGRGFGQGALGTLSGSTSKLVGGVRALAADFYGVSSPRYTADGKLVYAARRAEGDVAVITGGVPGPSFEEVVSPVGISEDGRHVAYVVERGDQFVEVRDHAPGASFPGKRPGASFPGKRRESHVRLLMMSPAGEHLAFEIVRCGHLAATLAPDSSHSRCLRRLVVDGRAGPEFDAFDIDDVSWSQDGTAHCYRVVGADDQRDRVVFTGDATRAYDNVFGRSLEFVDDRTIEFVAQDGLRFVRVKAVRGDGRPET